MSHSVALLPTTLATFNNTIAVIKLYGKQGRLLYKCEQAVALCQSCYYSPPFIMLVPEGNSGHARIAKESTLRNLLHEEVVFPFRVDGIELPRARGATIMSTRDCPSVVLVNRRNQKIVALHAGRDQLLHSNGGNFIADGLSVVDEKGNGRDTIDAYILGSISAEHFAHDQCPEKVASFFKRFGDSVFYKRSTHLWRLDLTKVICQLLTEGGVTPANIQADNRCTFSDPALGSRRGQAAKIPGKEEANWVLVMRNQFG